MSNESLLSPTTQALISLGLGQNEAILYEVLLKNPSATIPLLQSKSQFSRTMLYHILKNLAAYELVTESKKDTKTEYNAVAPEKLEDMIKEQEKELARQKDSLQDIIGDLQSTYRLAHHKPGVRLYEGKDGVISAYDDLLNLNQPIDSIEDKGEMVEFIPEYAPAFVKQRIKKGIYNRVVAPSANKINITSKEELRETHTIPLNEFPFGMDIKICGNSVLMATLKNEQAIAVRLDHPQIAENFRILFEYLFSHAALRSSSNPKREVSGGTVFNN